MLASPCDRQDSQRKWRFSFEELSSTILIHLENFCFSYCMFTYLFLVFYRQEFHKLGCLTQNRRGYITRHMESFDIVGIGYKKSKLTFKIMWHINRLILILINLLKPTGYGMHQQVEYLNNCTLCPYCIYVFCICLRKNSDLCPLYQNLFVFITDIKSVYSAVRTGRLNEAVCASSFTG
jgi:hypothetical protein